jgi:hypothetical protein
MNVLIAKQNQDIIKEILPKVEFQDSTTNTCFFKVSEKKFIELRKAVREKGYNPYSLMAW